MNIWPLLLLIGTFDTVVGLVIGLTLRGSKSEVLRILEAENARKDAWIQEVNAPDAMGHRAGSAVGWRQSCIEAQQQTIEARKECVRVMEQRDEYRVDADKWTQVHAAWSRIIGLGDDPAWEDLTALMGILANDAEESELIDG